MKEGQAMISTSAHAAYAKPSNPDRHNPWLRVEPVHTDAGVVQLTPSEEHRLQVHVGRPVEGRCKQSRFVHSRGDICIHPAGITDTWEEYQSSRIIMLHFPHVLLQQAAQSLGLQPDHVGLASRYSFKDARIEYLARALDAEHRSGLPSGRIFSETLALGLAIHLLSHHKTRMSPARGLSALQLGRVTSYIEDHLAADLSLAQLAALTHLSASHFRMLFKRSTGMPVHEYVIRRRVERAKSLLQSRLPVSQIALDVGFAHQSHMARAMRRILGITPQAARAALRRS